MTPYCDVAFAEAYFAERLHTEVWDQLTDDDIGSSVKLKALKHATGILETLNYAGDKSDPLQEYQFPRGIDTLVPDAIKKACCECAISLLDGINPDIELQNLLESNNQFANIKTNRDTTQSPEHILAGVPSVVAWRLIKPFLRDNKAVSLSRVS